MDGDCWEGVTVNTISENFDGAQIIRPLGDFKWPHTTFSGFPECCGIGRVGTVSQDIVPESILGLKVSPACFVHDWMFTYSPKNYQNFHYANSVFLVNLLQINEQRGGNWLKKAIRKPVILGWFAAVSSSAGVTAFFKALPGNKK
jgi:hypothetical protein